MPAKTADAPECPETRFDYLMEILGKGGISLYMNFHHLPEVPLFEIDPELHVTADTIAAMFKVVTLMATDTAFHEEAKSYCASIGSAVHSVTDPAWKMRDLTPEETAALNAEDPPRLNS